MLPRQTGSCMVAQGLLEQLRMWQREPDYLALRMRHPGDPSHERVKDSEAAGRAVASSVRPMVTAWARRRWFEREPAPSIASPPDASQRHRC